MVFPAFCDIQILDTSHAKHFQKRDGFRQGIGLGYQPEPGICQHAHTLQGFFFFKIIYKKRFILFIQLPDIDEFVPNALFCLFIQLQNDRALFGHIRKTGDQAQADAFLFLNDLLDDFHAIQQFLAQGDHQIIRSFTSDLLPFSLAFQILLQLFQKIFAYLIGF